MLERGNSREDAAGLRIIHIVSVWFFMMCTLVCCSRWSFASEGDELPVVNLVTGDSAASSNGTDDAMLQGYILK